MAVASAQPPAAPPIPAPPSAPGSVGARSAARRALAPAGLLGRLETMTGVTLGGLLIVVFGIVGWWAARIVGGRGLYLLVYCGGITLIISIVVARRKRRLEARRSELAKRAR